MLIFYASYMAIILCFIQMINWKNFLTIVWFDSIKFISSKVIGWEAVSSWQWRRTIKIAEKLSKICKRGNCSRWRVWGGLLIIDSSIHHHVVIISWVINWSIRVGRLHYQIIIILKREMALSIIKRKCILWLLYSSFLMLIIL